GEGDPPAVPGRDAPVGLEIETDRRERREAERSHRLSVERQREGAVKRVGGRAARTGARRTGSQRRDLDRADARLGAIPPRFRETAEVQRSGTGGPDQVNGAAWGAMEVHQTDALLIFH